MELSNEKIKFYIKRLLLSRMRILCNNGFYGLLLMHMVFSIDENCETAATDGMRIFFGPEFLDNLSDSELDCVMMHEILHVVLQHCFRTGDRDNDTFNIACDIVVNSNILLSNHMNKNSITLKKYGESMHIAPDGKEGYEYTAEQIYEMLSSVKPKQKQYKKENGKSDKSWDDHSMWKMHENDNTLRDVWVKRIEDAVESISLQDPSNSRGIIPLCAERLIKELRKPQTDWRTILNDFIQEEVNDYSFSPPDKRFDDSPFYLPDFNGKDDIVNDILFMIDTSSSMSDEMITQAYSEIKGAIDQFDGKLTGWLGFFDAAIVEPKPFASEEEFRIIRPVGGGGTDFQIIFEYVIKHMQDNLPASIIILTDGYAPFPQEKLTGGIPVLWIINNEDVDPPWGKTARIKMEGRN